MTEQAGAKHGILVVGLCGAVGAGKSAVAHVLRELGATVIDADSIAHEVLDEPETTQAVTRRWGRQVLDARGRIDRAKLGAEVFDTPEERKDLERLVHPRVRARMLKQIEEARKNQGTQSGIVSPCLIVIDAPLLLEAELETWCDHVVFVDAPREARLARLNRHHGWDEATVQKREAAQLAPEEKRRRSDYVIENFGALEELRGKALKLWELLNRR